MSDPLDRIAIADAIVTRLDELTAASLKDQFGTGGGLAWFYIDDLLPEQMALRIRDAFPDPANMRRRRTLRESKFVAAQLDELDPLVEEAVFAFQDPRIIGLITKITGLPKLLPDQNLYAGGISLMGSGDFLNPHLDNSHDRDRDRYRVLNLLYYCSPDWETQNGGHLELWPNGLRAAPVTIESRFNRLAVMTTGAGSWHSVSPVRSDRFRCCVSNYYFSPEPLGGTDYTRVTTFRGRPGQPFRNLALTIDGAARQFVRRIKPEGVVKSTHYYRRDEPSDP